MRSAITIAVSGSACSGKTTLAYLLEYLLPEALVIQQDDFQKATEPAQASGTPDAESIDSVDMAAFYQAIEECQDTGKMPEDFRSEQDPKDIKAARQHAIDSIPDGARQTFKERLTAAVGPHRALIVDGPLLYQDPGLLGRANIRLFLRTTKSLAKQRRTTHPSYGNPKTEDPRRTDAYFEDAVWPNYVKNSGFLFQKNDVEGVPKQSITELMGVIIQPDIESSVTETLKWAVDAICGVSEEEP